MRALAEILVVEEPPADLVAVAVVQLALEVNLKAVNLPPDWPFFRACVAVVAAAAVAVAVAVVELTVTAVVVQGPRFPLWFGSWFENRESMTQDLRCKDTIPTQTPRSRKLLRRRIACCRQLA